MFSSGDDFLSEIMGFVGYDFTMGADVVKCPYCGANVPCRLFFDNEVDCLECGKKFQKNEVKDG